MPRMIGKLPPDAEALLKSAAATGAPGSLARRVAIDRALDRVAEDYPEHFKSEKRDTYMKVNINTPLRGAFLALFEAKSVEGSDPKFNGKFIVDPASPAVKQLDDAMLEVAEAKWPGKGKAILDKLVKTGKPKNVEVCFVKEAYAKDGDQESPYDGFEGMYYLSASNAVRPLVIDRDRTPLVAQDGRPYSGCYMNVQVEIWAQDNKWGKGIRATLKGVQFVRDGDAFSGGGVASADDFADLGDGSDAGGLA